MLAVVLHLQHISSEMSPVSFQVLRSTSWLMAAALDSEQRESWVPNLFWHMLVKEKVSSGLVA